MPAKSQKQANLMRAAEHNARFPMAQKVRESMTISQMHDFAATPTKGKPTHVNGATPTKRPNNLGKFLHPKRSK